MAVSTEDLAVIDRVFTAQASLAEALAEMRAALPHLRWLGCDAADVEAPPFRIYTSLDLHLLDVSGHCVQLVTQAAQASGLLLARRVA